jgi:hypothetical protein
MSASGTAMRAFRPTLRCGQLKTKDLETQLADAKFRQQEEIARQEALKVRLKPQRPLPWVARGTLHRLR